MELLGLLFLTLLILFAVPVLAAVVGAFSGWVVGLFFSAAILHTLNTLGLGTQGIEMWELGATLGFIGGFFKPAVPPKKD
jgi:hypothetical protein